MGGALGGRGLAAVAAAFLLLGLAATVWHRAHPEKRPPRQRDVLALGLLGALVVGYFWRPLLSAGVWVPRGGGDLASFAYPMFAFAAHSLAGGVFPLWNSHLFAGMPFVADVQSGLLYPPNWLVFLQGHNFRYEHLELLIIAHYWVAGGAAYLFARDLRLSRLAAILAGVVFMLSGFLVTHLGHGNLVEAAVWLPLVLLCVRRAIDNRNLLFAALGGGGLALAALAGHTQISLYQVAVAGLYGVYLLATGEAAVAWPRRWAGGLVVLLLLYTVAGGLAAAKLLPGLELTGHSVRAELSYERSTEFGVAPIGLSALLLPHLWGTNPTDYWGPWSNTEVLGYVGIVPLVLAGVALLTHRTRQSGFFLTLAAAALLLSLGEGTILQGWLYRFVPGFEMVRAPGRFLYLFALGIALSAGFGLDGLLRVARGGEGHGRGPLLWLLGGVLALLVLLAGVVIPDAYLRQAAAPDLVPRLVLAIGDLNLLALNLLGAVVLLAIGVARWGRPALVGGLALALVVVDVGSAYHAFNPTTDDVTAGFSHPAALAAIGAEAGLVRIDALPGVEGMWQPDLPNLAGLQSVDGLFNPMMLADYVRLRDAAQRDRTAPLYNLLNVGYLVAPSGPPPPAGPLETVYTDSRGYTVYRRKATLPRAFLVERATVIGDRERLWQRLSAPDFDPGQEVLLEGGQPLAGAGTPPPARVERYGENRVELRAATPVPAYLVLADVYYPGWRARVDGVEVPVQRADYALRAVYLPPGDHAIELWFAPTSWTVGLALSLATLAIVMLWLAARMVRRRHPA